MRYRLVVAVGQVMLLFSALFSAASDAIIIGSDDRLSPEALISADEWSKYNSLGRVTCPIKSVPGKAFVSTGWAILTPSTVITASHAFYYKDEAMDPSTCWFIRFDQAGNLVDSSMIAWAHIKWREPSSYRVESKDYAIVKLATPLPKAITFPHLAGGLPLPTGTRIHLVAFHSDLKNVPRLTKGELYSFSFHPKDPGFDPERMFRTNADSSPGASGGMYINTSTGSVIGLHIIGSPGYGAGFNYALFFDRLMVAEIKAVAQATAPMIQE